MDLDKIHKWAADVLAPEPDPDSENKDLFTKMFSWMSGLVGNESEASNAGSSANVYGQSQPPSSLGVQQNADVAPSGIQEPPFAPTMAQSPAKAPTGPPPTAGYYSSPGAGQTQAQAPAQNAGAPQQAAAPARQSVEGTSHSPLIEAQPSYARYDPKAATAVGPQGENTAAASAPQQQQQQQQAAQSTASYAAVAGHAPVQQQAQQAGADTVPAQTQ